MVSLALFGTMEIKAQLADGSIAPNFTFTDMNGKTQDLYSYLNAGQSVVIDISATWCGPCWNYHNSGNLEKFYTAQGPSGTNKAVVLFIEGDGATTDADMKGTGSNTQGDWTKGTPYPMCNPIKANITPFNTAYKIGYFPTMYLICAANKKTKKVDQYTTAQLTSALGTCPTTTDVDNIDFDSYVSVFPSPSKGNISVDISSVDFGDVNVKIYNVMGEVITQSNNNSSNVSEMKFDLSAQTDGIYFVEVRSGEKKVVKKVMLNK